jgi:hypothetical protein
MPPICRLHLHCASCRWHKMATHACTGNEFARAGQTIERGACSCLRHCIVMSSMVMNPTSPGLKLGSMNVP